MGCSEIADKVLGMLQRVNGQELTFLMITELMIRE